MEDFTSIPTSAFFPVFIFELNGTFTSKAVPN